MHFPRLPALVVLILAPFALWAEDDPIYRCQGAGGALVFSDKPCASGADLQRIEIAAAADPGVDLLCDRPDEAQASLETLDAEIIAALPAPQRPVLRRLLAERAGGEGIVEARWGRGPRQTIHLCLTDIGGDRSEYLVDPEGRLLLHRAGLLSHVNDQETPEALRERCAETWSQCLLAHAEEDGDACLTQVPTCPLRMPWAGGRNCCPQECKQAYKQRQQRGEIGVRSVLALLDGEPSCIPGLRRR